MRWRRHVDAREREECALCAVCGECEGEVAGVVDALRVQIPPESIQNGPARLPDAHEGLGDALLDERRRRTVANMLNYIKLAAGSNFNRHFPDVRADLAVRVAGRLGDDSRVNVEIVRRAFLELLGELGWAHWVANGKRLMLVASPAAYPR